MYNYMNRGSKERALTAIEAYEKDITKYSNARLIKEYKTQVQRTQTNVKMGLPDIYKKQLELQTAIVGELNKRGIKQYGVQRFKFGSKRPKQKKSSKKKPSKKKSSKKKYLKKKSSKKKLKKYTLKRRHSR